MALHTSDDENTTTQAPVQAPRQQQQRGEQQQPPMSFHSGSLFAAPISRTVGSEAYGKLKAALAEIYALADEKVEITLIDLDNVNNPTLAFSSLIVAVRLKSAPQIGVAWHILTLAATGDKLAPVYENIASQQIEVFRVTSDSIDEVLMRKATEKVQKAFPNGPWHFCDATVVPADFNADDKYALHHLALSTGLACSTELEVSAPGFNDMNLATIPNDSSLNINVTFNRAQILDTVGQPMRSDIQVDFSSKRNGGNKNNASVNSGDREAKVYQASAFTDMVWNPVAPQNTFNGWGTAQPAQTQTYVSRLVITNVSSAFSYTNASVLLAIVAAQSVRDDNNWIQAFRPTATANNEIDITDIGALNIEANLNNDPSGIGTRIDTKSDSFKLSDLGKLMAAMVQPGMMVSLDCPEFGPQAWYTSIYISASNGSTIAAQKIFDAAQSLTNGNFSKHFAPGSQMFVDQENRIHLGTWTDRAGNKRDIRDIDHVAVCNLAGERNPQTIRDWSDTFLRKQYPLVQRLAARKRIISALTGETAVFTGFAQRVTFSRQFIDALTMGVRDTGLPVRVNTPLSGSDFNDQRAVAGFAQSALVAPGQTFIAGGAGGYQQVYQGNGGNFRF